MNIKYPIKNEYMKCVLKINGFSGPRFPGLVQSSSQVRGRATFIFVSKAKFRQLYELILHYVCHALHLHIKG